MRSRTIVLRYGPCGDDVEVALLDGNSKPWRRFRNRCRVPRALRKVWLDGSVEETEAWLHTAGWL